MKQHLVIKKYKFLFLTICLSVLTLTSCDHTEVHGIFVDHTLYENLTFSKRIELKKLIRRTLKKDEKALTSLNNFWCGEAAGCYDFGFIMTQIIYRIGEDEFIKLVVKLKREELLELEGLITVGLEYGDNNKDGKMDNKRIETEFPTLYKALSDKYNNE